MRFTVKNPGQAGNYRIPERESTTMYMVEVEVAGVRKQEGTYLGAVFNGANIKCIGSRAGKPPTAIM